MITHSIFDRLCCSPIPPRTAIALVALAWSSLAFCGEIHDAAKNGDLETVKTLLKGNPNLVHDKDGYGLNPLHWAASKGRKSVAELLLANKAEVNAKDDGGETPLYKATSSDNKDVVALLLAQKADANIKRNDGLSPLIAAVDNGNKELVELLLANSADINAKVNDGRTPLHWAAYKGNKALVEVLLAHKADVNATENKFGYTPLLVADTFGKKDIVELLRQHMGRDTTNNITIHETKENKTVNDEILKIASNAKSIRTVFLTDDGHYSGEAWGEIRMELGGEPTPAEPCVWIFRAVPPDYAESGIEKDNAYIMYQHKWHWVKNIDKLSNAEISAQFGIKSQTKAK